MRSVGRARREVDEERFVGHECFLLPDPVDGLVRHVCHQVVAFFGRLLHFDWRGAFIERWIPLMRFAADEPVEIFESSASGGPGFKRSGWTGLPDWHLMAFTKLCCRVAIELEGLREGLAVVRQQ